MTIEEKVQEIVSAAVREAAAIAFHQCEEGVESDSAFYDLTDETTEQLVKLISSQTNGIGQ